MTLLAVAVEGRGVVDPAGPVFTAGDDALLRGAAAFETIRLRGGRPVFLAEHLERLAASARALRLPDVGGAPRVVEAAVEAGGADEAALRLYRTSEVLAATVGSLPEGLEELRARGLVLTTIATGAPSLLAGVKATSYALNLAALAEAERAGSDDALFVGAGNIVLETTTANIWWREEDVLTTPAPGPAVLPGVTRGVLLELAREAGLRIREGEFTLGALLRADEAFTSSSVREVLPVVAVDGQQVGPGRPGAAARRLQDALRVRSGA